MSDLPTIPAAMREAAILAADRAADSGAKVWEIADAALTAALAVCKVREEWGCRTTVDGPGGVETHGAWPTTREPGAAREYVERLAAHKNRVYATRSTYGGRAEVVRRLVITTPPTTAPTTEETST